MKDLIYIFNEHVWGYAPLPLQTNLGQNDPMASNQTMR